jgi:hypothetical protein
MPDLAQKNVSAPAGMQTAVVSVQHTVCCLLFTVVFTATTTTTTTNNNNNNNNNNKEWKKKGSQKWFLMEYSTTEGQ